jgi:hypothetical protein
MNLNEILEILKSLGFVVALGVFFFFYFRNPKFKGIVNDAVKFLPSLLRAGASLKKDTKGVFDGHDALVLMGRVADRIKTTIDDPSNKSFEDVEQEVFDIVRQELARYKNLPGVPKLDDPAIRVQVKVVFEAIQRAMREDPTRDDS